MIKEENEGLSNNVRELRESMLMSKAELARKAGLSALTIDRVEKGNRCRMDTKRKILLALGVKLSERDKVFFEDEEEVPSSEVHVHQRERWHDEASGSSQHEMVQAARGLSQKMMSKKRG